MRKIFVCFLVLAFLSGGTLAGAGELEGRTFPDTFEAQGTKFVLKGMGVKTYFFFKIFAAGFYLGDTVPDQAVGADVSKHLEVSYFYAIPAPQLAAETRHRIILNTTPEEFSRIKARVDQMDNYYVNLKPGDRYTLTYIPNYGTIFTYNNKIVGRIQGYDFAKALFAVWIGDKPLSPVLKRNLLGKH
jgi:hypothetical protein